MNHRLNLTVAHAVLFDTGQYVLLSHFQIMWGLSSVQRGGPYACDAVLHVCIQGKAVSMLASSHHGVSFGKGVCPPCRKTSASP